MPSHPSKSRSLKRKRGREARSDAPIETSKPSAVFQAPGRGRAYTLSLALPGSIIANSQSHDLKTALAGRIARAAAVFCVDEIVVFDDGQSRGPEARPQHQPAANGRHEHEDNDGYTGWLDPDHFLCHLLTYLECPPNLRKKLFPMHPDLRTAGTLPSLDMPHHLKPNEWCEYREGVTVETTSQSGYGNGASKRRMRNIDDETVDHTRVDAGLPHLVDVPASIPANTRVTVRLPKDPPPIGQPIDGEVITPTMPREDGGFYWGYAVRQCASLSTVFTECPFEGGYDTSIGTSERGHSLEQLLPESIASQHRTTGILGEDNPQRLPDQFTHLLVVFGGVAGLEAAAASDEALKSQGIMAGDVQQLFDAWTNVCPGQGSRTIRTEEAVWLGLGAIKPYVDQCGVTHLGSEGSE